MPAGAMGVKIGSDRQRAESAADSAGKGWAADGRTTGRRSGAGTARAGFELAEAAERPKERERVKGSRVVERMKATARARDGRSLDAAARMGFVEEYVADKEAAKERANTKTAATRQSCWLYAIDFESGGR